MNAILTTTSSSDRALFASEWGPSRRELTGLVALDQRDAIIATPEDN
ncbi:MAG: hypothetical protein NVS3B1_16970 [Marmoricola sp.]